MQILIPTHNLDGYVIASLVNLILGSFFIANHIYERWVNKKKYNLMVVNAWVKGLIVLFSMSVIDCRLLFNASLPIEILSILAGSMMGYCLLLFEQILMKSTFVIPAHTTLMMSALNTQSMNKANNEYHFISTGMVGIFEEILYRGVMTILCLMIPSFLFSCFCLFAVTVLFALNHVTLGFQHVLSKLLLGLICLFSFWLTGSILAAVMIHLTFNLLVVKKHHELQYA